MPTCHIDYLRDGAAGSPEKGRYYARPGPPAGAHVVVDRSDGRVVASFKPSPEGMAMALAAADALRAGRLDGPRAEA